MTIPSHFPFRGFGQSVTSHLHRMQILSRPKAGGGKQHLFSEATIAVVPAAIASALANTLLQHSLRCACSGRAVRARAFAAARKGASTGGRVSCGEAFANTKKRTQQVELMSQPRPCSSSVSVGIRWCGARSTARVGVSGSHLLGDPRASPMPVGRALSLPG